MSVQGQQLPPYHAEGRRQCEARLAETVAKLQALASEATESYDRGMYLDDLASIAWYVRRMERMRLEWDAREHG